MRVVVLFFSKIPQKYKDISNILGHTASTIFLRFLTEVKKIYLNNPHICKQCNQNMTPVIFYRIWGKNFFRDVLGHW